MKTKVYVLGPVCPWTIVTHDNFKEAAEKLTKAGFAVSSCADFLDESQPAWTSVDLFRKRLEGATESEVVVTLEGYKKDDEAVNIACTAHNLGVKIYEFNDFLKNYEKYALAQ